MKFIKYATPLLFLLSTMQVGNVYALGGLNDVDIEDVTLVNDGTVAIANTNSGNADGAGSIGQNGGLLAIQQGNQVGGSIEIEDVTIENNGSLIVDNTNTGNAGTGGEIQQQGGLLSVQQN